MIPARRSATAPSWATSCVAEGPRLLGLDVEDPDGLVVPGQRHGQHRRDEAALVDAADPQEARVGLDVRDDQRLARRGDPAGHAFAERHAGPADLEPVEAVGRGQGQVRSVAVEQVERGDIRVEDVPGPVDDGLEQLVPRPGGRGEARHLVQEAELFELIVGRRGGIGRPSTRAPDDRSDGRHWSIRRSASASPYKPRERLRPERLRRGGRLGRRNGPLRSGGVRRGATSRASAAVAAEPLGIGSAGRARPARPRGPAARRAARPGHRRAGRAGAVRDSSSASDAGRSPSAATTIQPSARASTTSCAALDLEAAEAVIEAFGLYFGLVNLAEARGRVRTLRRRERACARRGARGLPGRRGRRRCAALGRSDAELDALVGRLVDRAGPHRPPDRGAPPDDARRAAPLRRPAGAAGRPAPDAVRGPRGPAPAARGDHAPVADVRPARRRARRRSTRSARRWRSSTRRCSRSSRGCTGRSMRRWTGRAVAPRRRHPTPAGPGRGRRGSGPSCGPAAGSAGTATATRASPRRSPNGRCASTPTTSCAATKRSRPG